MTLLKELTTVTRLSKTLALIMFATMPIIGFLFGEQYQSLKDQAYYTPQTPAIAPSLPKQITPTNNLTQQTISVHGKVVLGPVCGGEMLRTPEDQKRCADKPYTKEITVLSAQTQGEVTRFTPDAQGNFQINLPAGNYLFVGPNDPGIPTEKQKQLVTISSTGENNVTITFDTGIR